MLTQDDGSPRRLPDGSINIEHYVTLARHARAEEARALRSILRGRLRNLLLGRRLGRALRLRPIG